MIHVILGTKAQLIKMAPVMVVMKNRGIEYNFVSTGQHWETMDDILGNFGLKQPDLQLYSGPDITSIPKMLVWVVRILGGYFLNRRRVFKGDRSGIVLVHGDTFSTLLGALLAKLAGLKVGHVESGLRSHNLFNPFPEELTRLLCFRLSDYLFCPTRQAMDNVVHLHREKVFTEENTLLDALVSSGMVDNDQMLPELPKNRFAVVTLHRFENIFKQERLEQIVRLVELVAESMPVLFILHKPTLKQLHKYHLYDRLDNNLNVEFRPRYSYFEFVALIRHAEFVVSDGGSNQEECYYLGLPILLFRSHTEREHGVGENCLLSDYREELVTSFVDHYERYRRPPLKLDASPSEIIVDACSRYN